MPRNSSGTFTLVAGNPVVADTLIATNWANPTLDDIAIALTNSLDRNGQGSMLAAFKLFDGTAAAPGLAFNSESNTGLYHPSAGVVGFSLLGAQLLQLEAAKITAQQNIALAGGKSLTGAGSTSGSWTVGPQDAVLGGLRLDAAAAAGATLDINALPADGTSPASIRMFRNTLTTGVRQLNILRGDNTSTTDYVFMTGASGLLAQIARNGGRTLIGTTLDNTIDSLQIVSSARVRQGASGVGSNAAALAGYDEFVIEGSAQIGMSFLTPNNVSAGIAWGDPQGLGQGYVIYTHSTDQMRLGAAASDNLILDATYTRSVLPLMLADGTAAAPAVAFSAAPATGIFRVSTGNILGFATAGAEKMRLTASADSQLLVGLTTAALNANTGRGLVEINGTSDSVLTVAAVGAKVGYLQAQAAAFTVGTQVAVPLRFYINNAEAGRFTATGPELLVGVTSTVNTAAGRGLVEINGSTTSYLGLDVGNTTKAAFLTTSTLATITTAVGTTLAIGTENAACIAIDSNQTATYAAREIGWRDIPATAANAAMAATARGMVVPVSAAYTIPTGLPANSTVCLVNTTAAAVALTGFAGLHLAGSALTGNRTLAPWGFCTIWYQSTTVAFITGNVS
jgi:hypothetical protein